MITSSISFIEFKPTLGGESSGRASISTKLKPVLQVDNFNGKTMVTQNATGIQMALEFLGRKRRPKTPPPPPPPVEAGPHGLGQGYRNIYKQTLKATPNPDLRKELSNLRSVYNIGRAEQRISSLSRYLKEDMVGFITPSGHHWFEKALPNFIHGARARRVKPDEFKNAAKELWSLIAMADPYWTSGKFVEYLQTMESTPARDATIEAIKEITQKRNSKTSAVSFGYHSDLKEIKKLLKDGCAYTGVPMVRNSRDPQKCVSAEHIFPHSKGGPDNDFNFLLAAAEPNGDRGNIPLVQFLKGKNQGE